MLEFVPFWLIIMCGPFGRNGHRLSTVEAMQLCTDGHCDWLIEWLISYDGVSDLLADIGPGPLLSISPDTSMLETIRKLCLYHVHRMPVVDRQSGNLLCLLTHKRLLNYLYSFVSLRLHVWVPQSCPNHRGRKLAYYGHTMRKRGSCLEKEIMQGTMPGACRWGRPRTAWMDNINAWTELPAEESEWQRSEINGESMSMVWPTVGSRMAKEQNRTHRGL